MAGTEIRIGTSGWHYDHWAGVFYPQGLPQGERLRFYSRYFDTVEINNSFYRLPGEAAVLQWRETVPSGFLFAVKGSRFITHMKKLKDAAEPLMTFMERMRALGDRLGPILFQLPPGWRVNLPRLREFLSLLPSGHRYAFEFRDPSWFDPGVYKELGRWGCAFCQYQLGDVVSPRVVTADFVYIRLHGPGGPYRGRYGGEGLKPWLRSIEDCRRKGLSIYCYFDNDERGYAVEDALLLRDMVAETIEGGRDAPDL